MRSGFFALSALFVTLLLAGCGTNQTISGSAKTQPTSQTRNSVHSSPTAHAIPSNSSTNSTSEQSSTGATSQKKATSTNDKAMQDQKALVKAVQSRRNSTPAIEYPQLQEGSTGPAVLRLQEILASLGYMPVTWKPTQAVTLTANYEVEAYSFPPSGQWNWRNTSVYNHLKNFWNPSTFSVITKGAVMAFERDNGLQVDGVAGAEVWQALTRADIQHKTAKAGYSYVYVSKSRPERLTLWHNGKIVLSVLANTGIPASPTPNGTWPVYLRLRSQTMSGTNPNGTKYKDKGVPYISYFYQGDAVHGFIRASYGYPQSLGCVELTYANAKTAWNYLYYGALVTVGP